MNTRTDTLPVDRRRVFRTAFAAMCTFGMIIALLGTLFGLPEMRARLGIDLARQGDLFGVLSAGLLFSTIIVGPLLDRFGGRLVLSSAALTVTVGLVVFATAQGFTAAATGAALIGIGGGWLNAASNAIVSDTFSDDRGRMLNLLGIAFGIGALFVPLVVALTFDVLSIPGVLLVCAAVAGATAISSLTGHFPPAREGSGFTISALLEPARDVSIWLFALLLLFEAGNEAALSGWTSTYINSVGWPPRTATIILLGYWAMAIGGRALSARVQARVGKARLVLLSAALSVVGCLVLLAAASWLPALTLGAWMTALGFSAIFPTTLAIVGDRQHRYAGTIFGFLFTVGNIGTVCFPYLLGHISQAAGVRMGMLLPLAGTIGVMVCAVLVARRTASTHTERAHG